MEPINAFCLVTYYLPHIDSEARYIVIKIDEGINYEKYNFDDLVCLAKKAISNGLIEGVQLITDFTEINSSEL